MTDSIVVARSRSDYEAFGLLIREYWEWLRSRYADMVDAIGDHQGLTQELDDLVTVYGPPRGKGLLAIRGGEVVGGIAYRDLGERACEMKRLFVPVRFQGQGTGRLLSRDAGRGGSRRSLRRHAAGHGGEEQRGDRDVRVTGLRRARPTRSTHLS